MSRGQYHLLMMSHPSVHVTVILLLKKLSLPEIMIIFCCSPLAVTFVHSFLGKVVLKVHTKCIIGDGALQLLD